MRDIPATPDFTCPRAISIHAKWMPFNLIRIPFSLSTYCPYKCLFSFLNLLRGMRATSKFKIKKKDLFHTPGTELFLIGVLTADGFCSSVTRFLLFPHIFVMSPLSPPKWLTQWSDNLSINLAVQFIFSWIIWIYFLEKNVKGNHGTLLILYFCRCCI